MRQNDPERELKRTTYCQGVDNLFVTYAIDNVIGEVEAEITNFNHQEGLVAVRYSEVPWRKALRCGRVRDHSRLENVFVNVLHIPIRFTMMAYSGAHKVATLQKLVRYATSMSGLREGNRSCRICWNVHGDIIVRRILHLNYKRRENGIPVMSIEQRRGSVSSSPSSGETSKLSEHCKPKKSSGSR